MQQPIVSHHRTDPKQLERIPAGGSTQSTGLLISWQNGPLVVDGERVEPNGAFVETVIRAAIDRLEFYQSTPFRSRFNEDALVRLHESLACLQARTADREQRGVEGTHNE